MNTKTQNAENHSATRYYLKFSYGVMVVILLLAGCQVSVKDTKPPAVSLEEAKKITATFEGGSFTPPPRTINDVTTILTQEKPEDLKSYQQALSLANSEPPATDNALKLASFY